MSTMLIVRVFNAQVESKLLSDLSKIIYNVKNCNMILAKRKPTKETNMLQKLQT